MSGSRLSGWGLVGLLAWAGCNYPSPRLENPGPAGLQQGRAVRFDPYPNPEMGPEIVGGRPLGYTEPLPETVQAQHWRTPLR